MKPGEKFRREKAQIFGEKLHRLELKTTLQPLSNDGTETGVHIPHDHTTQQLLALKVAGQTLDLKDINYINVHTVLHSEDTAKGFWSWTCSTFCLIIIHTYCFVMERLKNEGCARLIEQPDQMNPL